MMQSSATAATQGAAGAETPAARRVGIMPADGVQRLVTALQDRGYRVMGPTVRDGAVVYDELPDADALPVGWTDEQGKGHYRLVRRQDDALFAYGVGPSSWKRLLFPPRRRLWAASRNGDGRFEVAVDAVEAPPAAFLGVRACELAALAIHDRILAEGPYPDPVYQARRRATFIVAVNCSQCADTCFCASMGTGPRVTDGYDLALTEILEEGRHDLLVEVGSEAGARVFDALSPRTATEADLDAARMIVARTAVSQRRTMPRDGLHDALLDRPDHPRWDDVADRCLACANCTMVCPTCFCSTVEDTTDLTGRHAERWQQWDSCFTLDFSYIHGGSVRLSGRSRYRQWLTHKLATWVDQFGSPGCVGCGRCIAWCPVGIDVTEEARALKD